MKYDGIFFVGCVLLIIGFISTIFSYFDMVYKNIKKDETLSLIKKKIGSGAFEEIIKEEI